MISLIFLKLFLLAFYAPRYERRQTTPQDHKTTCAHIAHVTFLKCTPEPNANNLGT